MNLLQLLLNVIVSLSLVFAKDPVLSNDCGNQVKEAAIELGYQPDETFCLKISQLRELFVVRWSVFLLGPSGCGKTAIWRTLMKAQNNAGEKTVSCRSKDRNHCSSVAWQTMQC